MKLNDIVVDKNALGKIVGKTTSGNWIVEWALEGDLEAFLEENLYLVEDSSESSEN